MVAQAQPDELLWNFPSDLNDAARYLFGKHTAVLGIEETVKALGIRLHAPPDRRTLVLDAPYDLNADTDAEYLAFCGFWPTVGGACAAYLLGTIRRDHPLLWRRGARGPRSKAARVRVRASELRSSLSLLPGELAPFPAPPPPPPYVPPLPPPEADAEAARSALVYAERVTEPPDDLYINPPRTGEVSVGAFEVVLLQRCEMLMRIHRVRNQPELTLVQRVVAWHSASEEAPLALGAHDAVSFWATCLAAGRLSDPRNRRRVAEAEGDLLRLRLLHRQSLQRAMRLPAGTRRTQGHQRAAVCREMGWSEETADVFSVPFELAVGGVGRRRVLLRGGVAYVHGEDFVDAVLAPAHERAVLKRIDQAHREAPIPADGPQMIETALRGAERVLSHGPVFLPPRSVPEDIENMPSKRCIACLRDTLSRRHLKHNERFVYGRFLLSVGYTPAAIGVHWAQAWRKDGLPERELTGHVRDLERIVQKATLGRVFALGCRAIQSRGLCPLDEGERHHKCCG